MCGILAIIGKGKDAEQLKGFQGCHTVAERK
jgi:hypothetical protein